MIDPSRRTVLLAALALPALGLTGTAHAAAPAFADLERRAGGRLGVAAWRRGGSQVLAWRGDERFPFCSTAKVMVVGTVLTQASRTPGLLDERVRYRKADLVSWSPVTEQHVDGGMTIADLCAATLQVSDNSACNLLLDRIGGPAAVTAFARRIGDTAFRLDRRETELNSALPGDPRDTTTPRAMANSLEALLLEEALAPEARRGLLDWMLANTTGKERIQAGFPADWRVADKTGTGAWGTTNDVGIVFPPQGQPVIVAIYYTGSSPDAKSDSKVVADAAAIVARALGTA
ncbi:class A beta-lactamase [Telluria mixta]|uniref:Beta-lactamase n=1 Tax=Telluria mixta TaxID=34071 RepID=A0ABT2C7D2_9BURK|nr:class A beta-lactamase [Telluria mixta]MCS0633310.1 class A beta-lactamase [Telluria mixta]WEM94790.1 class A beta-lactamase [Telluria mixta]